MTQPKPTIEVSVVDGNCVVTLDPAWAIDLRVGDALLRLITSCFQGRAATRELAATAQAVAQEKLDELFASGQVRQKEELRRSGTEVAGVGRDSGMPPLWIAVLGAIEAHMTQVARCEGDEELARFLIGAAEAFAARKRVMDKAMQDRLRNQQGGAL